MTASEDNWQSCDGEVQDLVSQLNTEKAVVARKQRKMAMVSMLAVLLVSVMAYQFTPKADASIAPISCSAVRGHTHDYVAGALDADTSVQVDAHLAYCSSCRKHVERYRLSVAGDLEVHFVAIAAL